MKKNWIRLLAVLLAAVMLFPATAYMDGEDYTAALTAGDGTSLLSESPAGGDFLLYVGETYQISYSDPSVVGWDSQDNGIATVSSTGLVTAVSEGTALLRAYDVTYNTVGATYAVTVSERSVVSVQITALPKQAYIAGEEFDPSGAVFSVEYDTGDIVEIQWGDPGLTCDKAGIALTAFDTQVVFSYRGIDSAVPVTVAAKEVFSVAIIDGKDEYAVGEVISGVEVLVIYNDRSTLTVQSGYTVNPSGPLTVDNTSYTVTYEGVTSAPKTITVKANGSGTTTTDYTFTVTAGPTDKLYAVGDSFDTTGLSVAVYDKNNKYITTLYASNNTLQVWPYVFAEADRPTGTATTSSITVYVLYNGNSYPLKITGLTVTTAKKTLNVRTTTGNMIYSMTVELKKIRYPVGTTLSLADISRIYGLDKDGNPFALAYEDIAGYTNTFSLEVAAINSKGETSRKSATSTYKSTITAEDVYTASNGSKYAYIRLYIDSYYTEFEVDSGESPVSVYSASTYSSSSLIGMYDELADALIDVNDVKHLWGSTATSTQAASRTLYIRLNQDDILGRYDYMTPARNIEIDLNGHKLTMYSDSFRFLDRTDTYVVTVTNNTSATAKVVYSNLPDAYPLLVDKNEDIVYKYQDSSAFSIPGIYTVTVNDLSNGDVTARPALSARNTVSVSHGNDVTFTITPDKAYQIDAVKQKLGTAAETTVNTNTNNAYALNAQTGVATYTMKDVQKDATFTVTFKAVNPTEPQNFLPGDMDGDGDVDSDDAIYLLRHTLNPARYPLYPSKPNPQPQEEWVNPFTDVNNYASYYEAVKFVNKNGIMNGITASTFGPYQTMTRAQFVTTLGRVYLGSIYDFETTPEKDSAMINQYGTDSPFSDVSYSDASLSYAVPYINWAKSSGLVLGTEGKFRPKDNITHEEMYVIMYRYAQLEGKSINVNSVPIRASDASRIGEGLSEERRDEAIAAIKYGQQQGFLVNSTFIDPTGNALRYELAILFRQFLVNVLGCQ